MPVCGEMRGRAGYRRETSRQVKAGPRIRRAARGTAYTPLSESRCFGTTVTTIDASTAPRTSQLASCETARWGRFALLLRFDGRAACSARAESLPSRGGADWPLEQLLLKAGMSG
jgi:hypothetical protein